MTTLKQFQEEMEKELIEKFADIEHTRWAKWQKYMHSHVYDSSESINPHLKVIPTEYFNRWERQILIPYSELSEKEKDSDREQVKPYIEHINKQTSLAYELGKKEMLEVVIGEMESNPNEDGSESPNIHHWIERKQIQLRKLLALNEE